MIAGFAFIPGKRVRPGTVPALAGLTKALTVSGGVAFAYGELGYLHTDGTVRKAQSDGTSAEAEGAVMCVQVGGVLSGASGTFRLLGVVTGLSGGLAGRPAFVSPTAGGLYTPDMSATFPPTTGFSKIVGRWLSSTVLWFCPSPEVAPFAL